MKSYIQRGAKSQERKLRLILLFFIVAFSSAAIISCEDCEDCLDFVNSQTLSTRLIDADSLNTLDSLVTYYQERSDTLNSILNLQNERFEELIGNIQAFQDSLNNGSQSEDWQKLIDENTALRSTASDSIRMLTNTIEIVDSLASEFDISFTAIENGKTLIERIVNNRTNSTQVFVDSVESTYGIPLSLLEDSVNYTFVINGVESRISIDYDLETVENANGYIVTRAYNIQEPTIFEGSGFDSLDFDFELESNRYTNEVSLILYY